MNNELNHFDSKGNAIMVDVTEKNVTQRQAIARGKIFVNKNTDSFFIKLPPILSEELI